MSPSLRSPPVTAISVSFFTPVFTVRSSTVAVESSPGTKTSTLLSSKTASRGMLSPSRDSSVMISARAEPPRRRSFMSPTTSISTGNKMPESFDWLCPCPCWSARTGESPPSAIGAILRTRPSNFLSPVTGVVNSTRLPSLTLATSLSRTFALTNRRDASAMVNKAPPAGDPS